ncbi:uncharacterized protein HGUI_01455 [Hanseniaspora guilliermondii]|uniref:Copper-fist domain-containing protein n=1 Tax=Hanseniaspora guilliermondii TaxID=56406 RepID=A0A1L0CWP4_9ASCO|nr:uncharacterized protein HGUI_01455 [Hanseniaspora guilliermondii]
MILIEGVKYACERCIRGHRATKCSHSDQPLVVIKNKGRPSTVCDYCKALRHNRNSHPEGSCSCGTEEKLKKKREQMREERRLKKIQQNAAKHLDTFSPSSENSSIVTNLQNNNLNTETYHSANCSCYDTGICNCHKTRKTNHKRISKKKHTKRRGSESSTDISGRILASHATDQISHSSINSFNSFRENSSMFSHDSFSNAKIMTLPHATNLTLEGSLLSFNNSGTNIYPLNNNTPLDSHLSSHTSPDDRPMLFSSHSKDLLKSSSKVASSSFDPETSVSPPNNLEQLTSINSFLSNSRRISNNNPSSNIHNDIHTLNEHKKTHWQIHNNRSNSFKRVDSINSFSTNNEANLRQTPDYSTTHATLFNPKYKENNKNDSHGLLDQVISGNNDIDVDLQNLLGSVPPSNPTQKKQTSNNEPLSFLETGLFDVSGSNNFTDYSFSKQENSVNVNPSKNDMLANFLPPEERIDANLNNIPMKTENSKYFDEFLSQNQDNLKFDEKLLEKSVTGFSAFNNVDTSLADNDFVNEPLPVTQSISEDFFNGIKFNNDMGQNDGLQKVQNKNLEICQVNSFHEKEDDEKKAMVLSLRPGTVGLSHLLGNIENER